jgi:hypothetical protein
MGKGKGKAGGGGAGGGPSNKTAAAGSSGQGCSSQGSSRPSAPPTQSIGSRTEDDAVQAAPPLAAEAAGGSTPQTEPGPAGNTKQDKERLRKERQRQRKVEVALKALQWAMEAIAEHGVRCVHPHEASRRLRISVHYTRASS